MSAADDTRQHQVLFLQQSDQESLSTFGMTAAPNEFIEDVGALVYDAPKLCFRPLNCGKSNIIHRKSQPVVRQCLHVALTRRCKSPRLKHPHQPASIAVEDDGQHDDGANDDRLDVVVGAQ